MGHYFADFGGPEPAQALLSSAQHAAVEFLRFCGIAYLLTKDAGYSLHKP